MSKYLMAICLTTFALLFGASGIARAQVPTGTITVVTIIDVLRTPTFRRTSRTRMRC